MHDLLAHSLLLELEMLMGGRLQKLICVPLPDYKRNSGKPFMRKENLAEHKRRLHSGASRSGAGRAEAGDGIWRLAPCFCRNPSFRRK
jgi:hypothetical protein